MLVDNFWLGGTTQGNGPHFYWMGVNSSLNSNTYINLEDIWDGPQYSSYCVQILATGKQNWEAANCDNLNYFICETI